MLWKPVLLWKAGKRESVVSVAHSVIVKVYCTQCMAGWTSHAYSSTLAVDGLIRRTLSTNWRRTDDRAIEAQAMVFVWSFVRGSCPHGQEFDNSRRSSRLTSWNHWPRDRRRRAPGGCSLWLCHGRESVVYNDRLGNYKVRESWSKFWIGLTFGFSVVYL